MNSVKFKIIIPVYNAEQTIQRCLLSILNQNYNDFTIICVNDQSTDKSSDKILEIENRYPNKIVLLNPGKKLFCGGSRQFGLNYDMKSEYVWHIDSDDFLPNENCLQTIADEFKYNNVDMVLIDHICMNLHGHCFHVPSNRNYMDKDLRKCVHNLPWSRIVRTEYSGKCFEGNFLEDNYNFYSCLNLIDYAKISIMDKILYCNFWNPNSLSRKSNGNWKTNEQYKISLRNFKELLSSLTKENLRNTVNLIVNDLQKSIK